MNKRKARLNLSSMIVTTKVSRCRIIVTNMGAMPTLANPTIPLPVVTTAIDALETAHIEAQSGNKAAIQMVYIRSSELNTIMRTTRDFVTLATLGDAALIVAAGFDLVKLPTPIGDLPAPTGGKPMPTDKDGEAVVRWGKVKGASSYVVEVSRQLLPQQGTETSEPWVPVALTQTAQATVKNLLSATYYLVRVAANGTKGLSGWSDPIRVLVR